MARAAFLKQLKHTCDVQIGTDGGTDLHGQPSITFDDETGKTSVACLWQEVLSSSLVGRDQYSKRIDYDGILFMAYDVDVDETRHITNIKNGSGTVIEAGPLRILRASDAAGQQHHLELQCKRVTIEAVS